MTLYVVTVTDKGEKHLITAFTEMTQAAEYVNNWNNPSGTTAALYSGTATMEMLQI